MAPALVPFGDSYVCVKRLELAKIEEWKASAGKLLQPAPAGALTPRAAGEVPIDAFDVKPKTGVKETEDVRTLWVQYDGQGERFKEWRMAVQESSSLVYEDCPLPGPLSCLSFAKNTTRTGGDPRLWLQLWCREKRLESTDRTVHELRTLTEAIYMAGTYDQLNLGGVLALEILSRRVHAIVEAYAGGASRPHWGLAKFLTCEASAEDAVSSELRSYAAKRAKEESDIYGSRGRFVSARDNGKLAPPSPSDKEEADDKEKKKNRRGGRGQGKGGAAAAEP